MAYSGIFKPKNPLKYKGNAKNIIYRSMWEMSYMMKLDNNPEVLWWQSEEVIVPYTHPISGAYRRYFPDFCYAVKEGAGEKVYMIEIKPAAQTKLPKPSAKMLKEGKTQKLNVQQARFLENQAKWESAERFCAKRGWTFKVLTEKELKTF